VVHAVKNEMNALTQLAFRFVMEDKPMQKILNKCPSKNPSNKKEKNQSKFNT
jgi:hypothetical protein